MGSSDKYGAVYGGIRIESESMTIPNNKLQFGLALEFIGLCTYDLNSGSLFLSDP